MQVKQHKNATTTPIIRQWIRNNSQLPTAQIMREKGLSRNTVNRWKSRTNSSDLSSARHTQTSSFASWQEALIVELRTSFLLPFDSLLAVVREFLLPDCKKGALERLLKRNKVNNLKDLIPQIEGEVTPTKSFKNYAPGFLHIDIKYLPKMPDEDSRKYLFVAIDRASRWVFMQIKPDKTASCAKEFLEEVIATFPIKIEKILTDNGKEFTDRFCATGEREASGKHMFYIICRKNNIKHRLIKAKHPQTNGMAERLVVVCRMNFKFLPKLEKAKFIMMRHLMIFVMEK